MTPPLSIQLYTLREEAEQGLPAVIARLGRIGYAGVESAGLGGLSPAEFRRCVEDAGMVVSGAHVQLPPDAIEAVLDEQEEIGNTALVVPFAPPERFESAESVRRFADQLNAANEPVRARGMALGYHNHWREFATAIDGESAHTLLFRALDPTIFAEIDTYWAAVGGADPAKVVESFGERARLLHIKDGPADSPKSAMTAVGSGAVDVRAIAQVSRADWHVVELDRCETDMFEAVEQSHRFLTTEGLARGRA